MNLSLLRTAARSAAILLSLAGTACAGLSEAQRDRAAGIASAARSDVVDCRQADACALASPLHDLGPRATWR